MSLPPKPPNQFSPDKPITQGYRPWAPVSNFSLMFPSANNANMIRPGPIYFTPLTTKKLQNSNEGRMNIPTPRDALLTSCSSPALKSSLGTSPSTYDAIKQPADQNFSTSTIRKGHYTQDASSKSYTPPPPHYFPPANYFPSELSQPAKATVSYPRNGSLNDNGTKECSQCPSSHASSAHAELHNANKTPIGDLHDITDLYPSETINIADYLPVIFS